MKKQLSRFFVNTVIGINILTSIMCSSGQETTTQTMKYKDYFLSDSYSHKNKLTTARNIIINSEAIRREMHDLLSLTNMKKDPWFYALTAIISSNDVESAGVIARKFTENHNRYFALSLGILGDKNTIPLLKKVYSETRYNYVKRDILVALRLLDDRVDVSPPSVTTSSTVRIKLMSSSKRIAFNQSFALKIEIENMGKDKITITHPDNFLSENLKIFSQNGHRVLPVRTYRSTTTKKTEAAMEILPQEEIILDFSFHFAINDFHADKWLDLFIDDKSIYLFEKSGFALNVSPYKNEDENYEFIFYVVLNEGEGDATEFAKKEGQYSKLTKGTSMISNTLNITVSKTLEHVVE